MECVTFHATKLFGQNERLFLTEPCRSPIPTSLAPVCFAMPAFSKPTDARSPCGGAATSNWVSPTRPPSCVGSSDGRTSSSTAKSRLIPPRSDARPLACIFCTNLVSTLVPTWSALTSLHHRHQLRNLTFCHGLLVCVNLLVDPINHVELAVGVHDAGRANTVRVQIKVGSGIALSRARYA